MLLCNKLEIASENWITTQYTLIIVDIIRSTVLGGNVMANVHEVINRDESVTIL